MEYQLFAPPPSLKDYVSHFWVLEGGGSDREQRTCTVMSNGHPGLIFLERPAAISGFEGERLPQLFVFGQATKAGQLSIRGRFSNLGVCFRPGALRSVFGIDAYELTHQNTDIGNLVKTLLAERLTDCGSVQQKVSCMAAFLEEQTLRHGSVNDRLNYAVARLQQGERLPKVLSDLNLSERSLERLFMTHTGITPVLYIRITRFQAALGLLRRDGAGRARLRSLTDIAHSLGYFDQSHFIRDFKLFSGVTPGVYLRRAVERMPGFPEWES
ncbi:MAG: AraC family transcriptional regulator [Bacteroidetes bacterium]|nr:AraC family transcriptional regulator [Bacteroidota bacterium]